MYDLIVIGAGPGGYVSAIKAAQLGMKVAVVEKGKAGGTCLNRGCIPTKTLLHAAEVIEAVKKSSNSGVSFGEANINLEELYQRKNAVVSKLVEGIENLLSANGVDLIVGTAKITGPHEVTVGTEILEANNILIAAGAAPQIPPIKGVDLSKVITSDGLLAEVPDFKRLVIVGGGVIGVEFASAFRAFGCEVTVIEAFDTLLPNFDKEISKKLALSLKKKGIAVHTKASVSEIQSQAGSLKCLFTSKNKEQSVECDKVLIAAGRKAYVDGLFAEGCMCHTDEDGIIVNENFQTNIPSIYAIGDVVSGAVQLAHAASAQGVNAVLTINGQAAEYDLSLIPSCVYTSPEIASAGMDEKAAKVSGIPIKIGKYNMAGNGKSMIAESDMGFIKVISHGETGELLGAQMMCDRATDMIMHFTQMIHQKVTVSEAIEVIYPHPTFSEGIAEALENTFGNAIHVMPMRK
ncbi:dihydrolipoyl dehydrogenase [Enterococcus sp. BWB1-3]|uniref:dihydrolipoyl dehydrogenase n=1 Tax=Enterococcus sp. BWB1-3 TaxID=2787713 RepID=UPI001920AF8E|nr:dihydrolipoyl dehydrogenase [Enterococcus sp. BWB1-3]MBL1230442.1 dihydrolipoyl dehydrogenase [Enterococcus sp. BWB1-3]